jgi:NADH:ubiquinone oxidoreductase subunit E
MIVQELHKIQHHYGYLPEEQLRRLAERLNIKLHRLHEVASFFPHFHLNPPTAVEVKVCGVMGCHLTGSEQLCRHLKR